MSAEAGAWGGVMTNIDLPLLLITGFCTLASVGFLLAAIFKLPVFRFKKPIPISPGILNVWAAISFLSFPLIVYCRQLERLGLAWPAVAILWVIMLGSIAALFMSESRNSKNRSDEASQ